MAILEVRAGKHASWCAWASLRCTGNHVKGSICKHACWCALGHREVGACMQARGCTCKHTYWCACCRRGAHMQKHIKGILPRLVQLQVNRRAHLSTPRVISRQKGYQEAHPPHKADTPDPECTPCASCTPDECKVHQAHLTPSAPKQGVCKSLHKAKAKVQQVLSAHCTRAQLRLQQ